jgi:hypothetical protein
MALDLFEIDQAEPVDFVRGEPVEPSMESTCKDCTAV